MKKTNTWFRYTAVLAVALLLSLALALVGCGGPTTPDNGDKPGDTTVTEGPETGVYNIGDYAFAECTGLVALDMSATEVWADGGNYPGTAEIGAFEGCNAIKVLSIGNISAPPSGGFEGCPFRGWTSEQTIFFEYHTSAQRFNFIDLPDWGVFPGFTSDWTKNHEAAIVFKDEAK